MEQQFPNVLVEEIEVLGKESIVCMYTLPYTTHIVFMCKIKWVILSSQLRPTTRRALTAYIDLLFGRPIRRRWSTICWDVKI